MISIDKEKKVINIDARLAFLVAGIIIGFFLGVLSSILIIISIP